MNNTSVYKSASKPLTILLGVIVVCGLSFYSGVAYQKGHQSTVSSTNAANRRLGSGAPGGFRNRNRIIGQVTAVTASSISVTTNSGVSKTATITSTTTITNSGAVASVSDIQVGDTVFVTLSSTNTANAASIAVNPNFSGYGPASGSNSSVQPTPTLQTN